MTECREGCCLTWLTSPPIALNSGAVSRNLWPNHRISAASLPLSISDQTPSSPEAV